MVSYSTILLDRYSPPGISEFTVCDAPEIAGGHPEASHWLANHFLNSAFRGTFKNKFRQYAFYQILRAQVAFADYQEARDLTFSFLSKGKPDNPAIREYFRALAKSIPMVVIFMSDFPDLLIERIAHLQSDTFPAIWGGRIHFIRWGPADLRCVAEQHHLFRVHVLRLTTGWRCRCRSWKSRPLHFSKPWTAPISVSGSTASSFGSVWTLRTCSTANQSTPSVIGCTP